MMVGLRREDAVCQSKWSLVLIRLLLGLFETGHPHLLGTVPDFKHCSLFQFRHFFSSYPPANPVGCNRCQSRC